MGMIIQQHRYDQGVEDSWNQHVNFPPFPLPLPASFIFSFPFMQAAQLGGAESKQGQGHEFDAHIGPESCSLSWPCQP